jgi:hypothetical protein
MKSKNIASIFILLLFVMCSNLVISQTYSSVKSYTLRTKLINMSSVSLNVFKCLADSAYLLQIRTSDNRSNEIDCSLKNTVFYSKMNKDDFRERIKKILVKDNLFGDNTEDLMDKLFNDSKAFIPDLDSAYSGITAQIKKDAEEIAKKKSETEQGKEDSISLLNHITFMSAASFDFSGTDLKTKFLASLNLFCPNLHNSKWGFNAGIQKINYSSYNDTNNVEYFYQNVLTNPLNYDLNLGRPRSGSRYLYQFNKYTGTQTNTAISFYLQPNFRILSFEEKESEKTSKNNKNCGVYVHGHLELLVNRWTANLKIEKINEVDTLYSALQPNSFSLENRDNIYDSKSFISGYFGVGLTFFVHPFGPKYNNSFFFLQTTVGVTDNFVNVASQDLSANSLAAIIDSSNVTSRSGSKRNIQLLTPGNTSQGFYLVKANLIHRLTNQSQLIIGTEIRGMFPRVRPLYAAYAGINLDLSSILGGK